MDYQQLRRRKNIWRNITIVLFLLLGAYTSYNTYQQSNSFTDPNSRLSNEYFSGKIDGRCVDNLTSPITDSNFVRVDMTLKGKELFIMDLELNNRDYVSGRGSCVKIDQENTEHTMKKYISFSKSDSILPLFTRFGTDIAGGNDFEISLKIYNLKNDLIGKYPEQAESFKGKIRAIALPVTIKSNLKLKRI